MPEIEIDFLGGNKNALLINDFMRSADVFEKGKRFVVHDQFIVTGNPDLTKLCERVANATQQAGGYAVFVGIRSINGVRSPKAHAWFMEGVQSLSMKQENKSLGWALFKDILSQLGYVSETDEKMRVISIGDKQ